MAEQAIRWGILGTGRIAGEFATAIPYVKGAKIVAVGSRTKAGADEFADRFKITRRHGSYESLVDDPQVDAVYISTPHPMHCDNTMLSLEAGKHVLCEKPFAINSEQANLMIDTARRTKRFLMEAMWSRFLPSMAKLRDLLEHGVIGEPRLLQADFGFRTDFNPKGRLFDPKLGGGALLDVGVYPVALSSMIFGVPDRVTADAHLARTGVDEQTGMILHHKKGQLSVLHTAVRTETKQEATLYGTEGSIRLDAPWWRGQSVTVEQAGKKPKVYKTPFRGTGYNHQIDEVVRCLRDGKKQSDIMPWKETLSIMKTLDSIRVSLGLRYPME